MIVIYTKEVTNRLKYVIDFIFKDYFGIPYRVTTINDFLPNEHIIGYGLKPNQGLFLEANNLLFETNIKQQFIDFGDWKDLKVFFTVNQGNLPFDIFSAIFYLLSRYEEYLPFQSDEHGRFPSHLNILVKNQIEKTPIVELWLLAFKEVLLDNFKDIYFKKQTFSFLSTIDVDHMFSYKGKSFLINFGGLIKRPKEALNRIKVLNGLLNDPFDHFDWLNKTNVKFNIKPIYFLLLSSKGGLNSQTNINSNAFKSKIKELLSQDVDFGLHSSYSFLENKNYLNEINNFKSIILKSPTKTRQHFLRISFPKYFQQLIYLGIFEDYSIGFSDRNGFRSGVSKPHYFFDLISNTSTNLVLFPFCIADHVDRFYLKRNIEIIQNEYLLMFQMLKKINGNAIVLFHNDTFLNDDWKYIYKQIFEIINKIES